jgi:hypothetical protein
MKIIFDSYQPQEAIPVRQFLTNKKLAKYFNRETAAVISGLGKLLAGKSIDIPFYYATGLLEYEDYGLTSIVENSRDAAGHYSQQLFLEKGLTSVAPLNQFKVLQNMPLCFAAIEFKLRSDSAVLYSSAAALLHQAVYAPTSGEILLGAGKVYADSSAAVGFAIVTKQEIAASRFRNYHGEAIDMLKAWAIEGAAI